MSTNDLDELDFVSAVWILASNDENHLLTFEGIRERLALGPGYQVRVLIQKRRELFRPGAPPGKLEAWKTEMRNDDSKGPESIGKIPDKPAKDLVIGNLTEEDVFRSQFRVKSDAPASPIEVVNWGLEHIDRIRKSRIASQEATLKNWQFWGVVIFGFANIFVTIGTQCCKTPDRPVVSSSGTHVQPSAPASVSQAVRQ